MLKLTTVFLVLLLLLTTSSCSILHTGPTTEEAKQAIWRGLEKEGYAKCIVYITNVTIGKSQSLTIAELGRHITYFPTKYTILNYHNKLIDRIVGLYKNSFGDWDTIGMEICWDCCD